MKLVITFLNHPEDLDDVLAGFLEIGVTGATVLDSVGMGQILSHDVPIFAGLSRIFPGTSPVNKTVLVVAEDDLVRDIQDVLEDVCGPFDAAGVGLTVVLPVDAVYGLAGGLP